MRTHNRSGQSTVEYILMVSAVVAVMIAFAASPNGMFRSKLTSTMEHPVNEISDIGAKLNDSHTSEDADVPQDTPDVYKINVTRNFVSD